MKPTSSGSQGQGQQKTHTATRVNPETGVTESKDFTQQEWKQRNKSEGWTRPDADEAEGDDATTGDTTSGK